MLLIICKSVQNPATTFPVSISIPHHLLLSRTEEDESRMRTWYMDGEHLTVALAGEEAVVEKLLSHNQHFEDKIGCGHDCIMVDRHPQFRCSRCLFVVRTEGGWIDFSYQKCLRTYIRDKYPSYAERFIREHFKRGSS